MFGANGFGTIAFAQPVWAGLSLAAAATLSLAVSADLSGGLPTSADAGLTFTAGAKLGPPWLAIPQSPRVQCRLEFFLAGAWIDVLGERDISAQQPIVCEYGIRGNTPTDRVANSGTLKFALNNSQFNSAQRLGYYSLLHANRRTGFDLNIPVRLQLMCPSVNGGEGYYKFLGTLDDAVPDPGIYGPRLTFCTATDIWEDYGLINEPDVPLQQGQRFDQIATTILDAMNIQPPARDVQTGSETYAFALDGGTGQKIKVRERFQQLAMSEYGYFYTRGGTTTPGTFVGENRHHRVSNQSVRFTLDNTMDRDGLAVPAARRDVYRTIRVTVHPTNDIDTTTAIVLFSIQQTETLIQAGETNDYIFGAYFDPVSHEGIGGYSPSPTYDLVAGSDYTMNTAADGTGTDQTASFTVSASRTGLGVRFTITNNGSVAAFVTKLQVRGIPIYRYDLTVIKSVAGAYGDNVLDLDMPFQNSANVAQDIAVAVQDRYSTPFAQAPAVRFLANRSIAHLTAALQLEPGDRVAVVEELTGLASAFTINGVHLEVQAGGLLWCQWYVEPASAKQYWLIGIVDVSELGVSTVLGY
jgi:hypothetical protein